MTSNFTAKFKALVDEGMSSSDEGTREFAIAVNLLLAVEGFGPDVFKAFFEHLTENVSSLEKLVGAMKATAEEDIKT